MKEINKEKQKITDKNNNLEENIVNNLNLQKIFFENDFKNKNENNKQERNVSEIHQSSYLLEKNKEEELVKDNLLITGDEKNFSIKKSHLIETNKYYRKYFQSNDNNNLTFDKRSHSLSPTAMQKIFSEVKKNFNLYFLKNFFIRKKEVILLNKKKKVCINKMNIWKIM